MRSTTFLRIGLLSLASAIVLSFLAFVCLRLINETVNVPHRQTLYLTIAKQFENHSFDEAMSDFTKTHHRPSANHPDLWIVDDAGKTEASSTVEPLPLDWASTEKPQLIHDFTTKYRFFSLNPEFTILRLDLESTHFLVFRLPVRRSSVLLLAPVALTFVFIALAVFLALSFTFIYLQRKSKEAKTVLTKLESGDLKARFKIQRIDEIGNLMLDFNRMAEEIERLIYRLKESEKSRRNLLQELSHDLRTPLTSLRTSIETLRTHSQTMSPTDRDEFFAMIYGELHYILQLVEDLFFIAALEEPRYKSEIQNIDLIEILAVEIKSRQAGHNHHLNWQLETTLAHAAFAGNAHLILRLFRNALDNAAKFATDTVTARIFERPQNWEVLIEDDGEGINDIDAENFGKRRERRLVARGNNQQYSLGMGSIIMKSIAELYGGKLEILNRKSENPSTRGTMVRVLLPKTRTI